MNASEWLPDTLAMVRLSASDKMSETVIGLDESEKSSVLSRRGDSSGRESVCDSGSEPFSTSWSVGLGLLFL